MDAASEAAAAMEAAPAMEERECGGGFMSTSLQKAAISGDVNGLVLALECTATNIDALDANGCTALMLAAGKGHTALVKALCDAGADTTFTDADGNTAEALAARAGHKACEERIAREAARREAVWSAIDEIHSKRTAGGAALPPRRTMPPMDDMMSKLLAQAGLPSGPAESPF